MIRKTCVLFLINSLGPGGAERQLSQLVREMDPARFELHVAVLYDPGTTNRGELWQEVASVPGVTLHSLHKRQGALGYLTALPRLLALIGRIDPDVLHGYLQGNLVLLPVGRLLRKPIVWGIRRTSADLAGMDRLSLGTLRAEVWLARFTDLVIFNSEAGLRSYRAMGMRAPRMQVIPNGFDVAQFLPDPSRGRAQRQAWGLAEDVPLIGHVGRLTPVKDHPTFLRAAARIAGDWPEARFVCVGGGSPGYAETLRQMADALGLAGRVLWPGVCRDMPAVYNALTALVLSSTDEGFPNVVGEAMACGIPCVTTRAGDAERLVGDTGLAVAPGDDAALAEALSRLLGESAAAREARSRACRARICADFSREALGRSTAAALAALVPGALALPSLAGA